MGAGLNRSLRKPGFTLTELLVVIGVISLLIGILMPALSRVREQSKTTACYSSLRQMGQAIVVYTQNNKGSLPFGSWVGAPSTAVGATDWAILLTSAITPKAGATYADVNANGTNKAPYRNIYLCPSATSPDTQFAITQYSAHPRLMPVLGDTDGYTGTPAVPYKITKVKRGYEVGVIFDGSLQSQVISVPGEWGASAVATRLDNSRFYSGTFMTDDYTKAPTLSPGDGIDLTAGAVGIAPNTDLPANWGNIRFRHNKDRNANVLMLDGHVDTFAFKDALNGALKRANFYVNP